VSKRLRIGIIGVGGIARTAHIPAYLAHKGEAEIVACADVSLERAQAAASEFGIPHAFGDFQEMLNSVELDAVSVCTPNKFHAPATIAALEAGCHVLCEKPPALSAAEAEAMVNKAKSAGKVLTFGLHYRFVPEVQACKRMVDAGELGRIYFARVDAIRRRGIPGWGVFTNKELQGGGPVIDIGVHMLDTALYLMGYPKPRQVLATTYQVLGKRPGVGVLGAWDWERYEVEDLAAAMIKFEDGSTILLETSFAQNVEELDRMNVRLSGELGGANLFPFKVFKEMHGGLYDLTPAWLPPVKSPYTEEVGHFLRACRGEVEPIVTLDQALRLQQVLDAIYRSAEIDDVAVVG